MGFLLEKAPDVQVCIDYPLHVGICPSSSTHPWAVAMALLVSKPTSTHLTLAFGATSVVKPPISNSNLPIACANVQRYRAHPHTTVIVSFAIACLTVCFRAPK